MALVSYDYDSGSENEEDEDNEDLSASVVIPPKRDVPIVATEDKKVTELEEGTSLLNTHLPLPKPKERPHENVEDDKIEDFVPKYQPTVKEKRPPQKVKITIPSLSQFNDVEDDEPTQKKAKINPKGSGLLTLLPPVKGSPLTTKSFVPNVLKNKPPVTEKSKANSLVPHVLRKKADLAKTAALKKNLKSSTSKSGELESDDDEDIEMPETFDEDMWQKACGRPKRKEIVKEPEESVDVMPTIDIAPEPDKPYDGLDNEAFKELVGKSKRPVNIKLIDINEDEVITDKDLWLTKSLTDPDQAPKPVIDNPVDPTRKKKHHITYLAEQAKANAQELESQWSSSKYNRQQTRAKYGF